MAFHPRSRIVNPRLGIYFGIFAASLVGVVMVLLILEQLGATDRGMRMALLVAALALFLGIGAASFATSPSDFLVSGRRVPASYGGPATALAAFGATGIGFDALVLPLGILAGFVVMAVAVAPFYRKFGAPSLPCFLGERFSSNMVRLAAAAVAATSLILLLVAEIKIAALAVSWLTRGSETTAAMMVTIVLVGMLAPGGVRSLSWSSAAQVITALLAILVPVAIVSVMETNLPLGQMSHGPVLRVVGRIETVQGIAAPIASPLLFDLPGPELQSVIGRFSTPFTSVGGLAFVLALIAIMAGTAVSPSLLPRSATAPTVYEARKAFGWTVLIAGVLITTMSTIAVLLRSQLLTDLVSQPVDRLSDMMKPLIDLGLAGIDGQARAGSINVVLFRRDGVVLALPVLKELPAVLVHAVAIGLLSAALAAAGSALTQLGLIVGDDVISAPRSELIPPVVRLNTMRVALFICAGVAGLLAGLAPGDPLDLLLWSLVVSGSSLFPVVLLAIWWKRMNAWGALAGLATGLGVSFMGLLATSTEDPILLPVIAAPLAFVAIVVVSRVTPAPGRHVLEMVRDLRVPSGETVHDREVRLSIQRDRQQRHV